VEIVKYNCDGNIVEPQKKLKTITTLPEMCGALCPLSLTDVHSFALTNELLSYVSVCYESVTWVHCVPFPINSFTDKNIASISSGALAVNEL